MQGRARAGDTPACLKCFLSHPQGWYAGNVAGWKGCTRLQPEKGRENEHFPFQESLLPGAIQRERVCQGINTGKPGFQSRLSLSGLGQVREGTWSCKTKKKISGKLQQEARKGARTDAPLGWHRSPSNPAPSPTVVFPINAIWDCRFSRWHGNTPKTQ